MKTSNFIRTVLTQRFIQNRWLVKMYVKIVSKYKTRSVQYAEFKKRREKNQY